MNPVERLAALGKAPLEGTMGDTSKSLHQPERAPMTPRDWSTALLRKLSKGPERIARTARRILYVVDVKPGSLWDQLRKDDAL